ncbi:MAG: hypothetical protein HY059_09980 [Proteobacteria bacterium]|nr:hypothetical protein [Pseudomonadota bacterium]
MNRLGLAAALALACAGARAAEWDWDKANAAMTCRKSSPQDWCGYMHQNAGWWNTLARCTDGYHWSYVLVNFSDGEDKNRRVLCAGVSTTKGLEEIPCAAFTGDLEKLKTRAAAVEKKAKRSDCFHGFGQDVPIDLKSATGEPLPVVRVLTLRERQCSVTRCRGQGCGCERLASGWTEIAACEGHQWFYVIEKDAARMVCSGIDGFAGPMEEPCKPFDGDLARFKKCAER